MRFVNSEARARSLGWNRGRKESIEAIVRGERPVNGWATADGWWVVSRHAAGIDAAYVAATYIRRVYDCLDVRAVNTLNNDTVEWAAEVHVKLKGAK